MNRRRLIGSIGVSLSVAGCLGLEDSVEDSDGDGVIDSQDYAPKDPAVQDKSDVQQTTEELLGEVGSEPPEGLETTREPETTESEFDVDDIDTVTEEPLPAPEIDRLLSTEPKLVSVDHASQSGTDQFTATVQNEGDNGKVHVSLYWDQETAKNEPESAATEKSIFFDSGERRTTSLYAEPPADVEAYEIRARTATRGATITNRGSSGNIKIELKGGELADSQVLLDSRTLFIGENQTETVTFDGAHTLFGDDWEIEVNPAEESVSR